MICTRRKRKPYFFCRQNITSVALFSRKTRKKNAKQELRKQIYFWRIDNKWFVHRRVVEKKSLSFENWLLLNYKSFSFRFNKFPWWIGHLKLNKFSRGHCTQQQHLWVCEIQIFPSDSSIALNFSTYMWISVYLYNRVITLLANGKQFRTYVTFSALC